MHVVVIGAVALGPKAACRFKRLMPEAKVTLIDQSSRISYGGCGIPFYISGEVNRVEELQATPYGVIRDACFFKTAKDIDVLIQTRANGFDRKKKEVYIENLATGEKRTLSYDKLVLALGSSPNHPPIPGIDLDGISPATNLDQAEYLKNRIASGKVNSVVVVGGGFIGLEMAVGIADMWGLKTSIVEIAPQIMPGFISPTFASMLRKDLEEGGVDVHTSERVLRFAGGDGSGSGSVRKVVTDKRELEADLVVMAAGISPNTAIAGAAGLALTERGHIVVNTHMQTSDPDIYSGGDCVTIRNLVTDRFGVYPLGSMANRQGRVIGTNLAGGQASFPGAVGSWGLKLSKLSACGSGLSLEVARKEGFDAVSVHVEQLDRAHFYPEHGLMAMEIVVEKGSKRVLGAQALGPNGDAVAARINAVAAVLAHKPDVSEISNLEIVYAPPFASAMDIVSALGNVAENILDGRNRPMLLEEFMESFARDECADCFVLDARVARDAQVFVEKYPNSWHSIPQDEIETRLSEIPKDKPLVVICNTGLRSFEAQCTLDRLGLKNSRTVQGGMAGVKRLGGLN